MARNSAPRSAANGPTVPAENRVVRCAIYTRKSTEEGLQQEFNSLDAQREAAEAYIASQKREGWQVVTEHFDDGGYTGGNMDRPALQATSRRGRVPVGGLRGGLQGRPAQPIPDGLRADHRSVRPEWRELRLGHAAVQHDDVHRPPDAEHPLVLRPVRARDHLRTHARQDVGRAAQRQVDRRPSGPGLRHRSEGRAAHRQSGGGGAGANDLWSLPGTRLPAAGPAGGRAARPA